MYIQNTNPKTKTTQIRVPGAQGVTWENSKQSLMLQGWRVLDDSQLPSPPEGERLATEAYIQDPDNPERVIASHTYEPIPDPMPAIIEKSSAAVVLLSNVLTLYGLEIPVAGGYDGAVEAIGKMTLTDTQFAMIGTLGTVYGAALSAAGSDETITAVYEAITGAQ